MAPETRSGRRGWAWACALFAALTLGLHRDVVRDVAAPRAAPPGVAERFPTLLRWNDTDEYLRHLEIATGELGRGRVYFPLTDFDCPVTFLLPGAAARRLTGGPPVAVLNGFALASAFLSGVFAFGFLRELGVDARPAAPLAAAYLGTNYVAYCHLLGHMNNVQTGWPAAALWACAALCHSPASWPRAALLGAAMAAVILSTPSYAVYLTFIALPAFCAGYWGRARRRGDAARFALRGAGAALLALILSAFYLIPRLGAPSQRFNPPTWLPFACTGYGQLLDPTHPMLFVGLPVGVLAVLAGNWWWANRTPPATACLAAAVAAALMMIPALPGTPHWAAYHLLPGFDRLRVPSRFLPLALLPALGLIGQYLTAATARRPGDRRAVAAGLLAALIVLNWFHSPWYSPAGRTATAEGEPVAGGR